MTDNAISGIDGRTVLVRIHKLFLADENPSIGIVVYADDARQPAPILKLTPEMATRLARDLLTVIADPDSVWTAP